MPQHIVAIVFLIGSLIATVSAARAALESKPNHPLVKFCSPAAAKAFYLASVLYLGAVVLLWLHLTGWGWVCGSGGFFATGIGAALASKPSS